MEITSSGIFILFYYGDGQNEGKAIMIIVLLNKNISLLQVTFRALISYRYIDSFGILLTV
jgi:hypothetical protein